MAFNLNNFVIDRIIRAVGMSNQDDSVLFAINQVTNASLNVTSETAEAVDALGTPIAIFNRAKTAEFSAENALFDMNLMAVQAGSSKKVAATGATIEVPMFEVMEGEELSKTPVGDVKFYTLSGDGSLGDAIAVSADGGEDGGVVVDGKSVTGLPTGVQVMAVYEYDANGEEGNGAISVVNSAKDFPKACKLVLEILGCDVCNQEELIYAYLILPNFKISPDFDWNLATDGTHPFSGTAMQDYCDSKKVLYQLIIAE